jgi:translocation and assembly module TamA
LNRIGSDILILVTRLARCLLLVTALVPAMVWATPNLEFSVTGLEGELQRNVLAFLGDPPQTPQERLNFMVSARERVERGLLALGYYRPDIELDVRRNEPLWQMDIHVRPGEPVRIRNISFLVLGSAAGDPEFTQLMEQSGLATGQVLHHGRFEEFRNRVLSMGQQRGYFDGEVILSRVEVEADAGHADVSFRYNSGPRYRFGELRHDDTVVDEDLLVALQTYREGDYFKQTLLQSFQSQLQLTRFFSSVTLQPLVNEREAGRVPILAVLSPAVRHSFNVGIGYSTDTEERLSFTWTTPKINRHGHSQITRLEYSEVNPSGRFTYNIPLRHPLNDLLQLWARTEENEFGDLDSQQDELGVRREKRKGSWVYSYSLRGLTESWEALSTSLTNDYLLLGTSISRREHKGPIVDPISGFNQLYTLEVANKEVGSDIDLLRFTGNLRYVISPFPRHRFLGRVKLGVAEVASGDRVDLAPSLNFFAGGNQSIRGFSYQSIGNELEVTRANGSKKTLVVGGDRLATGSLEYQYYFTDTWRGALFFDGGDAYDKGEFNFNYGAGFGIHYITPIGAIRVELANSLSEDNPDWYLHLTVGAEF